MSASARAATRSSRRGRSAAGSASPCQGEGRGFESRRPLEAPTRPGSAPSGEGCAGFDSRLRGGVAEWLRQGPAKPCTRVRFPPPPPPVHRLARRRRSHGPIGQTAHSAFRDHGVGVSTHRKEIERRPLYAVLTLAVVSVGVILVFGATAETTPPIFNTGQAQADVAPSIISAARPSLIPIPAPSTVIQRVVTPTTVPSVPSASPAASTPFAATYRPLSSARTQSAVTVNAPTSVTSAHAVTTPHATPPVTRPTSRHSTRPTSFPTAHPTPHRTTPSGSGDGEGSQLPWWWYLVPHQPTFPQLPRRDPLVLDGWNHRHPALLR
jgi:hypothetical protein